jgi:hypothetical protein
VRLAGASVAADGTFVGAPARLPAPTSGGKVVVAMPAYSAALVRLR